MYYQNPYANYGSNYTYGGGGYTYSPYGGQPAMPPQMMGGMQPQMYGGQMMPPMPPVQQMPQSMQTFVFCQSSMSCDAGQLALMKAMIKEELGDDDEDEEEDEEEYEEDEEEPEEVVQERKKKRKISKQKAKLAEKVKGLSEERIAELKNQYAQLLHARIQKCGRVEPCEGSIKPVMQYSENDPMVAFMREFDNTDLAGAPWDAFNDAIYLDEAMKNLGTNEKAIIHVVSKRSNAQRQEIKSAFKTSYGRDLDKELESELSGDFKSAIKALFYTPADYDAHCIKNAIYGLGTDESVLCEILMTRTNEQIKELNERYKEIAFPEQKAPTHALEEDIEDDCSGDFKRLLIAASQGCRRTISLNKILDALDDQLVDDQPTGLFFLNLDKLVNVEQATNDANKLYESGENCFGTDEEEFIRIFNTRDSYHLRRVYDEYVKITQCDIENALDSETSGDLNLGLYTMVCNIKYPPKYFAKRLTESMKGLGTADDDLIRIIVTRSEIDMVQIKEAFLEMNHKTLHRWIEEDCSGDYRDILVNIVDGIDE